LWGRIVATGKSWLSIFEFTVSIVQLQQKEVMLFKIEILSWLQVDGNIIFYCDIESVA
jgi:hypothetical protein